MDSPSNGSANYKLQAIKDSLKNGRITKEQFFTRLSIAVEQEYQKPFDEQDTAFLFACQDILDEMCTGKVYVSRKEECKKALEQRLSQNEKRHPLKQRVLWRSVLIACAFIILAVGVEMLYHHEWLEGASTHDGQQYVVQGQKIDPGIITEGVAANESRTGELTTANLDEAIKFLGFEPDLPTWIPDGWMLTSYEVGVITDETIIKATYAKADDMIVYIQKRYADLDNAYASFEQNAEGHVTVIGNTEVYCSENINRARYNWKKDNDVFSLAGKLSNEDANQMILSSLQN